MNAPKKGIRQIRQGDVLLTRVAPPPERELVTGGDGLPVAGLRVEGERTGHAHVLSGLVFERPDHTRVILLEAPTPLTHQEHRHIVVPAGWWEIRIQREWTPRGARDDRRRGWGGRFD